MFGRHAEVRFVKNKKAFDEIDEPSVVIPEEAIARVTRDVVNRVATGIIIVIGATIVLATGKAILVNSVDNYQKRDRD